jgi:predicted MFS family arabinose efflux permease
VTGDLGNRSGPKRADDLPNVILLAVVGSAGALYLHLMPTLITGLVHGLGLTPRDAGAIGAVNTYGAALGALGFALTASRWSLRPALILSMICLIAADLLSCLVVHGGAFLMAMRALQGVSSGLVISIVFVLIRQLPVPEMAFSGLILVQFIEEGLGIATLSPWVEAKGITYLFGALAAVNAVTLFLVPLIRLAPAPPRRDPEIRSGSSGRLQLGMSVAVLVSLFVHQLATTMVSGFRINIGLERGFTIDFISVVAGVTTSVALPGLLLVAVASQRRGRVAPILATGIVFLSGYVLLLLTGNSRLLWIVSAATSTAGAMMSNPLRFGLCAALDDGGRASIWSSFISKAGLGSGSLIGGLLAQSVGYQSLVGTALALAAASLLIAYVPASNLDRSPRRQEALR